MYPTLPHSRSNVPNPASLKTKCTPPCPIQDQINEGNQRIVEHLSGFWRRYFMLRWGKSPQNLEDTIGARNDESWLQIRWKRESKYMKLVSNFTYKLILLNFLLPLGCPTDRLFGKKTTTTVQYFIAFTGALKITQEPSTSNSSFLWKFKCGGGKSVPRKGRWTNEGSWASGKEGSSEETQVCWFLTWDGPLSRRVTGRLVAVSVALGAQFPKLLIIQMCTVIFPPRQFIS